MAGSGLRVGAVGVPISYPPLVLPDGFLVSCFLTPSADSVFTYPPALSAELQRLTGDYIVDVTGGDSWDGSSDEFAERVRAMDQQRFAVTRYLMGSRDWDLLFTVFMGLDRLSHFTFGDDDEPSAALRAHYRYLDERLGELIAACPPGTTVMVMSDHGVQRMAGRFCVNDWLITRGHLVLTEKPKSPIPLADAQVDWSKTRAWSSGFGGQIYINDDGRFDDGAVAASDVPNVRAKIERELIALPQTSEWISSVKVFPGSALYSGPLAREAPDVVMMIDDYRWLTRDTVGNGEVFLTGADAGPDSGSHTRGGVFAMAGDGISPSEFAYASIYDVFPTLMELHGLEFDDAEFEGQSLLVSEPEPPAQDEQLSILGRLKGIYVD
jgi:predicted AlkP superfamily phosphohydrolase/phosphomutase